MTLTENTLTAPKSILLVEDNPADRILITRLIRMANPLFEVVHAGNLKSVKTCLDENNVSLVILDLSLPESHGLETVLTVQTKTNIPIIVLTGDENEMKALNALKMGVQDYLSKNTLSADVIRKAIYYALERNRLQAELQKSIKQAQETTAIKSRFLANVSHEIRTPMNAIIGFTQAIAQIPDMPAEQRQEYADIVVNSSEHLLCILNDLLDMAKIEANELTLENTEFSIPDIIEKETKLYQHIAGSKNLTIDVQYQTPLAERVIGDSHRLRQIISNLFSNAIKFTEEGGLKLSVAKYKETYSFKFQDSGIGIPQDKIETLFEPFQQTDLSHSRKYGGTGLGLNIVQKLVRMMDGTISVDSKERLGTCFIVQIPLQTAQPKVKSQGNVIALRSQ